MDVNEFENRWSQRNRLSPSELQELEEAAAKDAQCRDYVSDGEFIRSLLLENCQEKAPDNFAYRMRIYAANHKHEHARALDRPLFRWGSLLVGATTAVAAVVLSVGPLPQSGTQQMAGNPSQKAQPVVMEEPLADTTLNLAVQEDDSLLVRDPAKPPSGDWRAQTVSTER